MAEGRIDGCSDFRMREKKRGFFADGGLLSACSCEVLRAIGGFRREAVCWAEYFVPHQPLGNGATFVSTGRS